MIIKKEIDFEFEIRTAGDQEQECHLLCKRQKERGYCGLFCKRLVYGNEGNYFRTEKCIEYFGGVK